MQKTFLLIKAAACAGMLFLAACNSQPETLTSADPADDMAGVDNAAGAPVKLPPMMTASKTYRCDDNSLIYVDFFNDNVTAHLRKDKNATPTILTAPEKDKPFVADGYTLTGTGGSIKLAMPGKGAQDCKA
jgi:hypothetical protein